MMQGLKTVVTDQEDACTSRSQPFLVRTVNEDARHWGLPEQFLNDAIFFEKNGSRICVSTVKNIVWTVEHYKTFICSYPKFSVVVHRHRQDMVRWEVPGTDSCGQVALGTIDDAVAINSIGAALDEEHAVVVDNVFQGDAVCTWTERICGPISCLISRK